MTTDIRLVAQQYIADGWAVLPLRKGQKRASGSWRHKTYEAKQFRDGDTIAAKCGPASGHRIDVDLDALEAVHAAPVFLPDTGRIHGRTGKPRSHYWYRGPLARSMSFTDVDGTTLVEIRADDGHYTALPPSTHPAGVYFWDADGPELLIAEEQVAWFIACVKYVATTAILARHWAGAGSRHRMVGHVAGFLCQLGLGEPAILAIIRTAATCAGDTTELDDRVKYAQNTIAKFGTDPEITGGPSLAGIIGEPAVSRIRSWWKGAAASGGDLVLSESTPLDSAREFVARTYTLDDLRTLQHQLGVFYRYDRGVYTEHEEESLRAELYRFLDQAFVRADERDEDRNRRQVTRPFHPTSTKVSSVLDAVRAEAHLSKHRAAPCWLDESSPAERLLACRNGLLNLDTRSLSPLTPAFFTVNGLDLDYDPQVPAPCEWLAFLDSVWPDDQEAINTLQEIFGYLLTPDTHFQKIFLLIGPKRSGKGTIANVLRHLHGQRNLCNPTMGSFGQPFGKQSLIGKTVAIINDARITGRTDLASVVETLLSISGGDQQTIPRKFLEDWTGTLATRFVICTNELPRLGDASGALASRFIILQMTRSWWGNEDHDIYKRCVPEIAGILNWALDGRQRLYERGHLVQPASGAPVVQQLDDLNSPVKTFLRECCDTSPTADVPRRELFAAWKQWCNVNNITAIGTSVTFGRDLHAALPDLRDRQRRTPKVTWCYIGVAVKPDAQLPDGVQRPF